jgi:hypothetical protein
MLRDRLVRALLLLGSVVPTAPLTLLAQKQTVDGTILLPTVVVILGADNLRKP